MFQPHRIPSNEHRNTEHPSSFSYPLKNQLQKCLLLLNNKNCFKNVEKSNLLHHSDFHRFLNFRRPSEIKIEINEFNGRELLVKS